MSIIAVFFIPEHFLYVYNLTIRTKYSDVAQTLAKPYQMYIIYHFYYYHHNYSFVTIS